VSLEGVRESCGQWLRRFAIHRGTEKMSGHIKNTGIHVPYYWRKEIQIWKEGMTE
jgi:hypothetical protein